VRVVSLVPSVTETLMAWSVRPVAVTRFCEQPDLPTVGGTKNPDVAAIVDLRPDLVVLDKEENRAEDAAALEAATVPLEVLHVTSLADVEPALGKLATSVQRPAPPPLQVDARPSRLRVFVPIWRRPWMSINHDTYGSTLLEAAGATNVLSSHTDRYPEVELDEVAALKPDVVLAPSEPYAFTERHRAELERVAPVVFVDGKDLFWWGVRTQGALDRFTDLVARLP
jgi:ABC-type Fe3+-hydroxamate transport system substrate-binding protein